MKHYRKDGKKLCDSLKQISDYYFFALQKLKERGVIKDSIKEEENDYQSFIDRVARAYEKLDYVDRKIINNDFFYEDYPGWWIRIYSKSTYYRLKKRSMRCFLEAFKDA